MGVQVAVGEGFFNPVEAFDGYLLRNELVHGSPVFALDVEGNEFVESRRWWAFLVLQAWIRYVAGSTAFNPKAAIKELDHSEAMTQANRWIGQLGREAEKLVQTFRAERGLPAIEPAAGPE